MNILEGINEMEEVACRIKAMKELLGIKDGFLLYRNVFNNRELLDEAIDEFIIPLANQFLDKSNLFNIVDLCFKAKEWLLKNIGAREAHTPSNPWE